MATPTTLPATFVSGNVLTAAQMNNLRGAFRVLQVVQTVKTDTFSTTSTTMTDITGISVTITPSDTSSKVLVIYNYQARVNATANHVTRLMRGATAIALGDAAGSRTRGTTGQVVFSPNTVHNNMTFLDSPATTSATTYKLQCQISSGTLTVNSMNDDLDTAAYGRTIASITAIEISA
jgi:hypothetical protein